MLGDYITFASARATQADALETAIATISSEVRAQQSAGRFVGAGPVFVGIGASLAAACAPVWELRSRGIHSWRLGAGDHPLPFPVSQHPIIGISQSGKSTETLAVLGSIDEPLRYAVVNNDPSPVSDLASAVLSLGNIPDSYASTIGYTATVTALGMIAEAWDGGEIDPGWATLPELFRGDRRRRRRASRRPRGDLRRCHDRGLRRRWPVGWLGRGWGAPVPRGRAGALRGHEHAAVPARQHGVRGGWRARAVR